MNSNNDILFEGSAGFYRSVDLESAWGDDGSLISFGSDISSLGFIFLGDLMCSSFAHIIVRSYAHPADGTYAVLMTGMKNGRFNVIGLDFFSGFADGASLTTTTVANARDMPAKGIFRKVYAWNGVYDLYHKHQKHLTEFKGDHGEIKPIEADLLSLAKSLDSFFVRQLG